MHRLIEFIKPHLSHNLECITYREDEYFDGYPALSVLHCDTCGIELIVAPEDLKDLHRLQHLFPKAIITNSDKFGEITSKLKLGD